MKKIKNKEFPKNIEIKGLSIITKNVGIKSIHRDDVAIVVFKNTSEVATILTKSKTCAANIQWLKKIKNIGKAKVLFVNSGNANAYTGEKGKDNLKKIVSSLASKYDCNPRHVIVSSTGVIGEQLPMNKIIAHINQHKLINHKQIWTSFAKAIMTTDTFLKGSYRECYIGKQKVKIMGVAKGSGMIAPNMATMLGFIFTDANLSSNLLKKLLSEAAEKSFNRITVDNDMSTNDMVCLFSTKEINCGPIKSLNKRALNQFKSSLEEISIDLAKRIILDGEGAKKLIQIEITGANSDIDAKNIAFSVANSPLVKTAIAGEDANWGRIIMAVGKAQAKIKQELISLSIGELPIISFGKLIKSFDEKKITKLLRKKEISININMSLGKGKSKVWTCDFTKEYIKINADYRS